VIDPIGSPATKDVTSVDAALYSPLGSLGDFVWKDSNNDGIQNEIGTNAGGVVGVQVELYKVGTTAAIAKDTTDATGHYLFPNLPAGTYYIKVLTASIPAGCSISAMKDTPSDDAKDSDVDATGQSGNYVIDPIGSPSTKDVTSVDAALYSPCILPNFKITTPALCSVNNNTWSIGITVTQAGTVKVNKGVISGSGTGPYTITNIPSGVSLVITDSLSATCKKDTTILPPANCGCVTAPPVVAIGQNLMVCKGDTFPTLKATVIGYDTVDWYKKASGGTSVATGTLSYKLSGNVVANDTFYLASRNLAVGVCPDPTTQRTMLIVVAQNCLDTVDLALKKLISKKWAKIGDVIDYTIKVWNESKKNATGVEVTDNLNAGVQYISSVATRGSYDIGTKKWTIGNVAAPTPTSTDTVTLIIKVKVLAEGVWFNTAEISNTNEKDKDSTSGNGIDSEDDIDRQCFSVPLQICVGQGVEVSVPSNYTGVVWKDGQGSIVPSNAGKATLTKAGTYTFTATNGSCPAGGCCPVIVEEINCCPVNICVPFTITKRRK
jgi:uncharacterized repeat protein (TIGR01451 family)